MHPLVLGTRGSRLALRQAEIIRQQLGVRCPERAVTLRPITAQADQKAETPLATFAGEGIFVKELERELLAGRIDAAVHSLKDVPLDQPEGLRLAAVPPREESRDALVSRHGLPLEHLPAGSRIGTSSVRRQSQLRARRPDLSLCEIRGNVDTRLRKLDEGRYDAIIVAGCGLMRLGLAARITELLDPAWMLPEPGQGALAVEARADDEPMLTLLARLEDPVTRACVEAERAFLKSLGGGCRVPIAALATLREGELLLEGAVVAPDGSSSLRHQGTGRVSEPQALGERLAKDVIARGALSLLSA